MMAFERMLLADSKSRDSEIRCVVLLISIVCCFTKEAILGMWCSGSILSIEIMNCECEWMGGKLMMISCPLTRETTHSNIHNNALGARKRHSSLVIGSPGDQDSKLLSRPIVVWREVQGHISRERRITNIPEMLELGHGLRRHGTRVFFWEGSISENNDSRTLL